jgi:hypothetical protein
MQATVAAREATREVLVIVLVAEEKVGDILKVK